VEALGGFSMKLGSLASTAGSTAAKGTAWTGGVEAGGEGGVGVGVDAGRVGGAGGAGGEEGVALLLLVIRPSSVASSSSSSSS